MFDDTAELFKFITAFIIITLTASVLIAIIVFSSIAIGNVLFECGHVNCSNQNRSGVIVYESNS